MKKVSFGNWIVRFFVLVGFALCAYINYAAYVGVAYWRTTAGRNLRRTDFTQEFNTFGVDWTEDYIFTYLNSRLVQTLFTGFKKDSTLWQLGKFQSVVCIALRFHRT